MKILYAEDEKHLSKVISAILEHNGYEVSKAYDGEEAYKFASENTYDALVLDIMMPKMTGLEVMKKVRESGDNTPIIMLTAKAEVEDKINGLDAGANDYLTKPFATEELLARIRAVTRKSSTNNIYTIGNITIDTLNKEIKGQAASLRLQQKECELLVLLINKKDMALTDEIIFNKLWQSEGDKLVVSMYVSFVNKKLDSLNADIYIDNADGYSLVSKK